MDDSSASEEFNSDLEFIEKVMDYRSKLGIHWFLATSSMIRSDNPHLKDITEKTQMLAITDMANNRFFPLVTFERPDMAALKEKFLDCEFSDAENFKPLAFNTSSAIEGFCEGVMRCATVLLTKHIAEFDPATDFEKAWKEAIEKAVAETADEIRKEIPLLVKLSGFPIEDWKFKVIPHKIEIAEKLETGADYSLRAIRKKLTPR